MRNIQVTVGPLAAASANNIALSQTPTAGNLILNGSTVVGGVAVLDKPRRVLLTVTANENANTFTIFGTNWSGATISETITGPSAAGTAQSVLDYATVTRISISGNAVGALTVGTSGVASSPWVCLDHWALAQVAVQCNASGTVNYTVQSTLDNPNASNGAVAPSAVTWINSSDTGAVGASSSIQTNFAYTPTFARILLNSGTGSVVAYFAQSGSVIP
jgi:hypothetical protein